MTTVQPAIEWGGLLAPVQAKFDDAERALTRTRNLKAKTQIELDRLAAVDVRAHSTATDATFRKDDFERRALEAERKLQQMKRRGLPRNRWNRWEAEQRHWRAEGEQSEKDVSAAEDDARRANGQVQQLFRQIRDLTLTGGTYLSELKHWEGRLSALKALTRRFSVQRPSGGHPGPRSFGLAAQAESRLYQMMALVSPRAGQALRMTAVLGGGITLRLDYQKKNDEAFSHRRRVVMIVENPALRARGPDVGRQMKSVRSARTPVSGAILQVPPAPVSLGEVGGHLLGELGEGLFDGGRAGIQLEPFRNQGPGASVFEERKHLLDVTVL